MFTTTTVFDATSAAVPSAVLAEVRNLWNDFGFNSDAYVPFNVDEDRLDAKEYPVLAQYIRDWGRDGIVLITYGE